jgi:hypothetical protein
MGTRRREYSNGALGATEELVEIIEAFSDRSTVGGGGFSDGGVGDLTKASFGTPGVGGSAFLGGGIIGGGKSAAVGEGLATGGKPACLSSSDLFTTGSASSYNARP